MNDQITKENHTALVRSMEKAEAQLGVLFTGTERDVFTVGFLDGASYGLEFAKKTLDPVLSNLTPNA